MKKRYLVLTIVLISLAVISILTGCNDEEKDTDSMPALHGGQEAKMIELSTDDFATSNHIVKNIDLIQPGSLIVSLGANPTTGFEWQDVVIDDNTVIIEQSHNYVPPQTDVVGAPGKDVWVFDSQKAGETIIKMSYSRPWEGGEKDEWTLTISVSVK